MATIDAEPAAIDDSTFDEDRPARRQEPSVWPSSAPATTQVRDRAAVDEPVMHGDVQAELEADAAIEKAELDQDADLEI